MTLITAAEESESNENTSIPPPQINKAMYAYLYSIDNNQILYTKNSDHKIYPASFTKMITAIIALEHYENTSKKITVTKEMVTGISGNNIALKVDEVVTVENMINAVIVGGSNDAAQVLAIDIAGSIAEFVTLMNNKAENIGTIYTTFTNPTGMHDEKMSTTMDDMAKIALYAYKLNRYTDISSQQLYDLPETNMSKSRRIVNRNYYVSNYMSNQYYNSEAMGLNSGSTPTAGYCLATVVNHDGLTYLCMVSGASSDDKYVYSYLEADKLLTWVYSNWGYVNVLKTTVSICQLPVRLSSKSDSVTLHPQYEVELYLPSNANIEKDVERVITVYEDVLTAPVASGQVCGELGLYYQGQLISKVPLITKNYIDKSQWMYFVDFTDNTINQRWFKTSAVTFVILFIVYVLINAKIRYDRVKKRNLRKNAGRNTNTRKKV
jgi:D-alanyl-D-alanine carboxypeptidase